MRKGFLKKNFFFFFWSAAARLLNIGFLSLCIRRQPWALPARPARSGGGGLVLARVPRRPLQRAVRMTDRKPSRLHPLQRTTHLSSNGNPR